MTEITMTEIVWTMVIAALVLSVAVLFLVYTVYILVLPKKQQATVAEGELDPAEAEQPGPFSWTRIRQRLTDAVPVAQESSIDLGHDYDGIRELDNNLPPWWKYGFYLTIAIGIVYFFHFQISSIGIFGPGHSQSEEYEAEMIVAAEQKAIYLEKVANLVDENSVQALTDAGSLANGEATYTKLCATCHGPQGQGGIGPNLTDPYWVHGGGIKNIFSTIKYGVLEKGMLAWQTQLKPVEMQEVASFILTMEGTNPPNPKEAQGELYVPSDSTSQDTTQMAVR